MFNTTLVHILSDFADDVSCVPHRTQSARIEMMETMEKGAMRRVWSSGSTFSGIRSGEIIGFGLLEYKIEYTPIITLVPLHWRCLS